MPQPQITGDSSQERKERYHDVVHVDVCDDDEGGGGDGSEDDVVDDDDDYDAVCVSRKMITSHFQAERQRREVSRQLGLAGRRPALA